MLRKSLGRRDPDSRRCRPSRRDGMIGPGKIGYGGTYNGNSMCLAAANATLDELMRDDGAAFKHMHLTGADVMKGLRDLMARHDESGIVQGIGPMFQLYFTEAKKILN